MEVSPTGVYSMLLCRGRNRRRDSETNMWSVTMWLTLYALCLLELVRAIPTAVTKEFRSVQDLHREYHNIFRFGNRNAASHLWSSFILDRSEQMTEDTMKMLFSGFCAVSGSPVRPSEYNKYGLLLDTVFEQERRFGFMHYCCWPCVCDTQDFIKVDTKTVRTKDKGEQQYHFAVVGNPCAHPEELSRPFFQPFDGRQVTLREVAQEVRCRPDGTLEGAIMSDHNFVIISMFFDSVNERAHEESSVTAYKVPQPGRMSVFENQAYQSEFEFRDMCEQRKHNGYNSGMGEIFRKVCEINPITRLRSSAQQQQQQQELTTGRKMSTNDTL